MTKPRAQAEGAVVSGVVVEVDYDADTIVVELSGGEQKTLAFELFDSQDVYRPGQAFDLRLNEAGEPLEVTGSAATGGVHSTVTGYVESVDQDDELAWVYIRTQEGWQRKVMPLSLFQESGLARPGAHFLLDLDEQGTPLALRPEESELEMLPQSAEQAKPRWTNRPAAEAD